MAPLQIIYWHWWIIAVGLILLERQMPGRLFLWPALAAGNLGILSFYKPDLTLEQQLMLFASLSIVIAAIGRWYLARYRNNPAQRAQPFLNQQDKSNYHGYLFTLDEPIVNGRGKLFFDQKEWPIQGPDCPKGTWVKILAIQDDFLQVKPHEETTRHERCG
jgi:hypothetical protein